MSGPPLGAFSRSPGLFSDYLAQLQSAAEAEAKMEAELVAMGWVFHPEVQIWTHPDRPGMTIGY